MKKYSFAFLIGKNCLYFIIYMNNTIFLISFIFCLSHTQILLLPARPQSQFRFGSVQLNNMNFQVLPPENQSSSPTGFSTDQKPKLVHLPFPRNSAQDGSQLGLYELFGIGNHNQKFPELSRFQRSSNGQGNNLKHRLWGSAHIPLLRRGSFNYQDGLQKPNFKHLNPRQISNILGKIRMPFQRSLNKVTAAFVFWGQFLDHDLSLSEVGDEYMPIGIPMCDEFMDKDCTGSYEIPFNRSFFWKESEDKPREQVNFISAWLDGSQVYGSDEQTQKRLRKFQKGEMVTDHLDLLPRVKNNRFNLFQAGDIRVNENVILTSYHTIFVREHNRLAKVLLQINPSMGDEEIFQAARNYVVGLLQKITYEEFLPTLIGRQKYDEQIGQYKGYNDEVNPGISNEFSTAAFRIGHALMINQFPLFNRYKEVQSTKRLHELFFNPDFIDEDSMAKVLRGVTRTLMKEKNPELINELRNLLIPGPEDRLTSLDLFALNIQRGLDHGLPNYNEMRRMYKLQPLQSFEQMTDDPELVSKLKTIYEVPDNCDLWVCIISEKSLENAVLGELGATIVGDQFQRIRDGDRFWYERDYPISLKAEIKSTQFAEVMMRNTGVAGLQFDIFHFETD